MRTIENRVGYVWGMLVSAFRALQLEFGEPGRYTSSHKCQVR